MLLINSKVFSNFFNLEQLHMTNAFTETIDSQWYLRDLKDVFATSNLTKLKKLHLEQNEIWDAIQCCDYYIFTKCLTNPVSINRGCEKTTTFLHSTFRFCIEIWKKTKSVNPVIFVYKWGPVCTLCIFVTLFVFESGNLPAGAVAHIVGKLDSQ